MFHPMFHLKMREKRRTRALTQAESAAVCGIKRSRWSDLERGVRIPDWRELRAIDKFLGLGDVFVPPRGAHRALLNQASRLVPTPQPFFPSHDRTTHIRYRTCCREYPGLIRTLFERLVLRKDFQLCEYFCHRLSCDSRLEALHLLHLLQRGAVPALLAPSALGHTRWPIVSCDGRSEVGFRPRPCLALEGLFYFFQVSFATPRVMRVDTLCWQDGWSILEINGHGHSGGGDKLRAATLELPHSYLSEEQLLWLARGGLKEAS